MRALQPGRVPGAGTDALQQGHRFGDPFRVPGGDVRRFTRIFDEMVVLGDRPQAISCDESSSSRRERSARTKYFTVASSSWVDRMTVGERIGNPALDQSFIEAFTDPSGKKKWAKHPADRRSREISPGTQVKVIGRERTFRQIRVEGEEAEWWVSEEDLERME